MELAGLSLAQLLAVLGAAGALTFALYLLKRRQRRVAVPFIALWEGVLKDRQSSQLFARLRHLLSLLLALLIVALLAFALADPRPRGGDRAERNVVLLVDAGLSMQATDVAPNRLAAALKQAQAFVANAGPALHVLVAQMDAATTPLSPLSADPKLLAKALEQLAPSDLATEPQRAYRFALDVLQGRARGEIAVLSDRAAEPEPELARALARAGIRISHWPIGRRGHNVGISAFAVRRYPLDKNRSELLIELTSASPHAEEVQLSLFGDGAPIDAQRLTLAPGATLRRSYGDVTGVSRTLEARIQTAAGHDDLAADDRAFATLPERKRTHVLCVTEGNRYLEAALLLDEYLDVDVIAPAGYRGAAGYDAVIFDRFAPAAAPEAPALYLAASGPGAPLAVTGALPRPRFDQLQAKHPLLRFTALRDVNISEAQLARTEPGDQVIAGDARGPLIVAGTRAGRPFVALTFEVGASDLPLRAAWPLLVLNAIDGFTQAEHDYQSASSVGRPVRLELPRDATQVELREPGGSRRELPVLDGELVFTPLHAGFYTARWGGEERVLAANLAPATTREIAPRALPSADTKPPSAPALSGAATWPQKPWVLLALGAVLLLLVEWLTYHLRITV